MKKEEYFDDGDKIILYGLASIFIIVGVYMVLTYFNLWGYLI